MRSIDTQSHEQIVAPSNETIATFTAAADLEAWLDVDFTSTTVDQGLAQLMITIDGQLIASNSSDLGFMFTIVGNPCRCRLPLGPVMDGSVVVVKLNGGDTFDSIVTTLYDANPSNEITVPTAEAIAEALRDGLNLPDVATIAAAIMEYALSVPSQPPSWPTTPSEVLRWVLASLLQKSAVSATSGTETIYAEDGTTPIGRRVLADDGSVFTRGVMQSAQ